MELEDPERLFDLTTVKEVRTDTSTPGRVRKRIITVSKPVLQNSTITFKNEKYVRYDEVSVDEEALALNINLIRPCATSDLENGHSPCMPSLRLEMLDREYSEPVRDREKDWVLHSQRPIFNEKGKDIISPKFDLRLGKYKKVDTVSKQFWAKEYQTMLRECLLMRQSAIISDTNCVVEIYGVGFTGRLFAEGATSPKLLVIEVYSIWNSQKYMLVLTVMELRLLLVEKPDFLKPGRRADLLKFLLGALYFEYMITIPPREDPNHPHAAPGQHSSQHSLHSKEHAPKPEHDPLRRHNRTHTTKQDREAFKHNLQKHLMHHKKHGLTDADIEEIIPVNTHHDPAQHIEVHIDHSVPHLQIHFEDAPATPAVSAHASQHASQHGTRPTSAQEEHSHAATIAASVEHSFSSPRRIAHEHEHDHEHRPHTDHVTHSPRRAAHPHPAHPAHSEKEHAPESALVPQTVNDVEHVPAEDVLAESETPTDGDKTVEPSETEAVEPAVDAIEDTGFEPSNEELPEPSADPPAEESGAEIGEITPPPPPAQDAPQEPPQDPFSVAQIQTVVHLDPPKMPKGYPTTVEQMIRVPPVQPDGSQDPLPIVTQQLHIGAFKRINGPKLRKLQAVERRIAQEKEDARLLKIWLATPKRRRNLKGIRLIRRCNYMVLLAGYFDPLRPNTIILKGTVSHEATRMSMFLGLGKIRDILRINTSCQTWSSDELSEYVTSVLRFAGIVRTDSSDGYAINVTQATGLETTLLKSHTVVEFLSAIRARQRHIFSSRMHDPDSLAKYYVNILDFPAAEIPFGGSAFAADAPEDYSTRPGTANTVGSASSGFFPSSPQSPVPQSSGPVPMAPDSFASRPVGQTPSTRPGWTSLGAANSTRAVGVALGSVLRPAREIGKPRRLSCRGARIGHVYCTYSLYANTSNMPKYRGDIPVWPVHQEASEKAEEETVDDESTVKQDSDDEDFMKPAGDSDDDSDSDGEGDGGSISTKKKSKKKKKGKGRLNRKSSKIDPDELMNEESAELNEADAKNDVYAMFSMGLMLELFVYLPESSAYQGLEMPSGTWKMKFTVDDLDPLFYMREEKERVARALRAVYYKFFESATAEEVRQAEEDWDWLAHVLVKRSRWAVRGGRSSAVVTTASEVQSGIRKLDAAQDVLTDEERLVYIQSLLFSDAEPVRSAAAQEKSMFSDGPSMKFISSQSSFKLPSGLISAGSEEVPEVELVTEDPPPFVTLTWPSTVWTKAMKIRSAVESRGESVRMQVTMFQKGEGLGVICVDRERGGVFFAQHPDSALQLNQIQSFRFITEHERSLQIFIFLTASLSYAETTDKDNVTRGRVTFLDVETSAVDTADVMEEDYSNTTELLLAKASTKAQARLKRK